MAMIEVTAILCFVTVDKAISINSEFH